MAREPLHHLAADVGRHLLVAIDNGIPTNPTPEQLRMLADAYGQVASHLPKGQQYQHNQKPSPSR